MLSHQTGSLGAATTLTLDPGSAIVYLQGFWWSYDGVPISGKITLKDGANVVFELSVTVSGNGFVKFDSDWAGTAGNTVSLVLAASTGLIGKINAQWSS